MNLLMPFVYSEVMNASEHRQACCCSNVQLCAEAVSIGGMLAVCCFAGRTSLCWEDMPLSLLRGAHCRLVIAFSAT